MNNDIDWNNRFLELANYISNWSKDPSTKVGAVIVTNDKQVVSMGYNGFPRGIEDTYERLNNREIKYSLVSHGESNAILHASRYGISIKGCKLYVNVFPCSECAKQIIQSGINEVYTYKPTKDMIDRWEKSFNLTKMLFKESGVKLYEY